MSNTRLYPIFCLQKDVEIDDFSQMIDWAYKNQYCQTVLMLDEKTVKRYQEIGLWEVVSAETENWLFGLYEDDWIFDFDVMRNTIKSIHDKYDYLSDENIKKIIFILGYAIENKKSVIFYL